MKYTAVMRENDRNGPADGVDQAPPAGVPQSPYAYAEDGREPRSIPIMLTATVNRDTGEEHVAQTVADACAYLVRTGEGWYRAYAYVWVPPVRMPDPDRQTQDLLTLIVSVVVARPAEAGVADLAETVKDVQGAVAEALNQEFPGMDAAPEVLPLGPDKAEDVIEKAGGVEAAFVTTDVHPSLITDSAAPEPEPEEEPTYRFVDVLNRGWHIASGRDEPVRYAIDFGGLRPGRPEDLLTREELEAAHGPLRPVAAPDPSDVLMLKSAFAQAGPKAAASLLVALYRVAVKFSRGSTPGGQEGGSLIAGREGSWESDLMMRLAWNLGGDLDEKPGRYSEDCVRQVLFILGGWTASPKRYVEVAENLASIFGRIVDDQGGWAAVADRYLQPGARVGHSEDVIEAVRNFLFVKSRTSWDTRFGATEAGDEGNEEESSG